jgi:hypothetical protein
MMGWLTLHVLSARVLLMFYMMRASTALPYVHEPHLLKQRVNLCHPLQEQH